MDISAIKNMAESTDFTEYVYGSDSGAAPNTNAQVKKRPPFTVVYEDGGVIAVNKAAGISVGGDRWDESKERLDKILAASLNPGKVYTVHRIDRDTSGLVVFAKTSETHKQLSLFFEDRQVKKRYTVIVHGRPSWTETSCDLPLVPNGNKLHHTIIDKYRGKKSLTRFRLLGSAGNYSVVEAEPETGRTHQIRVHLSSMGHPVVCDEMYGNTKPVFLSAIKRGWRGDPLHEVPLLARLGLHAAELFVPSYIARGEVKCIGVNAAAAENETPPPGGAPGLRLEAPLPRDMSALIKQMEKAGRFLEKQNPLI